jgi:Gpi18-like mannosyltransferase
VKKTKLFPCNLSWLVLAVVVIWDVCQITPSYFYVDWQNFWSWARNIQADGLGAIYADKPLYNYPPLMAYSLWLFAKGFGSAHALQVNFFWYKLFPLAFDFGAAVLAVKWAGDRRREALYLLLLIANPIYIFNSYTWGQIDSTYCALVFFALFALVSDRPVAALLLYTLAFNFKIQALLFAPPFGLIILWKFNNPWPGKRIASACAAAVMLQFVILLPFLQTGETGRMFAILKNPVNYYRAASMDAFNFWQFCFGLNAFKTDDSIKVLGGWSAQQAGLALFFEFSVLVLGPVLVNILKAKIQHSSLAWSEENILLMCSLIPLGFFFFCTQMHERYSQPAILFLAVYSFRTRRYGLLAIMFLAYGLNMEIVFNGTLLADDWLYLFSSVIVPALFAGLIASLLRRFFQSLPRAGAAPAASQALAHG